MSIDASIFRSYDIRGLYPQEINEEAAYLIGKAYAAWLGKKYPGGKLKAAVGMDMRLSSPSIKERLVAGLLEGGLNVDDLGLVSTPTFYFAVAHFGYDGGLQVSASHLPGKYNGIKLVVRNAVPLSKDSGILELRDMILAGDLGVAAGGLGVLDSRQDAAEIEAREQAALAGGTQVKPFKIVIDAANAMGALDMEALFKLLPCEVIRMNFELDGNFPAHEADPLKPENTKDLCERVVAEGADLGIAPDGDGDRYFFVDEKGQVVAPAILRGLMAQIELKEHPGATVAYDVRPGRITKDMIDEMGGKAVITRVGHSLIKETMIKEGAIFGGESSGHYFYKLPWGTFEAPMVMVLKLLRFLSEANGPFSETIKPFERYAHSGEINFKIQKQEDVKLKLQEIKEKYPDGAQNELDGVSIEYPDFWFNVRGSANEPLLRLNMEARTPEVLERELAKFKSSIFGEA